MSHLSTVESSWKQVPLEGYGLKLSPLVAEDAIPLWDAAGLDAGPIWKWYTVSIERREQFLEFHENLLREMTQGLRMTWTIRSQGSEGSVLGCTSFMSISERNKRVEIGSTWVYPAYQKSPVNTAAKILLLEHAFEVLGCLRVELKTDSLNESSMKALEALGATREGLFRNHMITDTGRVRHTVWYAFYQEQWSLTKQELLARLDRKQNLLLRKE